MKPYRHNREVPRPEQLAAYLDGELDAQEQSDIEAYLAQDPAAAADVEAHRALDQLWKHTRPAAPPESAWVEALDEIEAALSAAQAPAALPRQPAQPAAQSSWRRILLRLTAAAAAVGLIGILEPALPPEPAAPGPVEPFEVASSQDVDILNVTGSALDMLVVGDPSLQDPLDLATAGEVVVQSVQPDTDGMLPQVWGQDEATAVPMIVAPLVTAQTNHHLHP